MPEIRSFLRLLPGSLFKPSEKILESVRRAGGRGLIVGGAVRDALLGRPVKDIDIEVFGMEPKAVESMSLTDRAKWRRPQGHGGPLHPGPGPGSL